MKIFKNFVMEFTAVAEGPEKKNQLRFRKESRDENPKESSRPLRDVGKTPLDWPRILVAESRDWSKLPQGGSIVCLRESPRILQDGRESPERLA